MPAATWYSLQLITNNYGWYGSDKINSGRVDADLNAVRRLENAQESPVENLSNAVAADWRIGRYFTEAEAIWSRSAGRRPVENSNGYATNWKDRLHPNWEKHTLIDTNKDIGKYKYVNITIKLLSLLQLQLINCCATVSLCIAVRICEWLQLY